MSVPIVSLNPFNTLTGFTADASLTIGSGRAILSSGQTVGFAKYNTSDTSSGRQDVEATVRINTASADNNIGVLARMIGTSAANYTGYLAYIRWIPGVPSAQGLYLASMINGSIASIGGQDAIGGASIATGVDYKITINPTDRRVDVYVQRLSDNLWLCWNGAWVSFRIPAACDANPSGAGITGAGGAGIFLSRADNTGDPGLSTFYFGQNPTPQTQIMGTAYVNQGSGSDETGVVGNKSLPYATANGAFDATLPGSRIVFSPGRHPAPVLNDVIALPVPGSNAAGVLVPANIQTWQEGITLASSGLPPKALASGLGLDDATGTILNAVFGLHKDDVTLLGIGIDSGQTVNQTTYGFNVGTGIDTAALSVALDQTQLPAGTHTTNIVVDGLCLINQAGIAVHDCIDEDTDLNNIRRVESFLAFAGVVGKLTNSTVQQIRSFGQGFGGNYGLIFKSNHYADCHHVICSNVYIDTFTGTGGGAVSQGAGALAFSNNDSAGGSEGTQLHDITISDIVIKGRSGKNAILYELGAAGAANIELFRVWSDGTFPSPPTGITVHQAVDPTSLVLSAPVKTIVNGVTVYDFGESFVIGPNPTSPTGAAQVVGRWVTTAGTFDSWGRLLLPANFTGAVTATAHAAADDTVVGSYTLTVRKATENMGFSAVVEDYKPVPTQLPYTIPVQDQRSMIGFLVTADGNIVGTMLGSGGTNRTIAVVAGQTIDGRFGTLTTDTTAGLMIAIGSARRI